MNRLIIGTTIALAFGIAPAWAQTAPKYEVDATWPKPLPKDWITGQLGGVCTAEQDHIYVVNRRNITDEEKETSISAPSIIKFDMEGNVVGSWATRTPCPIRSTVVSSMRTGMSTWPAIPTASSRSTRR